MDENLFEEELTIEALSAMATGSQSATLGLKGQKSVSPEQHPGDNTQSSFARKGQKHFVRQNDFDPMDRLL